MQGPRKLVLDGIDRLHDVVQFVGAGGELVDMKPRDHLLGHVARDRVNLVEKAPQDEKADQRQAKKAQQKVECVLILEEIVFVQEIGKAGQGRNKKEPERQNHPIVDVFLVEG